MNREAATPEVHALPGDRASAWIDRHHRVAAPSEYSHDFVWDVTAEAAGPFVTDVDGNVFLDFTSHIGAAPLGYNNPAVLDRLEEFDLVDPIKTAGQDLYFGGEGPDHPGSTRLMEGLVDTADRYGMDTVFLSNSGAEAIENALKVAYAHRPTAKYGVTFRGAFHGRTLGTLSITRAKDVYTRRYPELAGVQTVPYCEDRTCTPDSCTCGFYADGTSALRDLFEQPRGYLDPDEVAFVVLEPIQGVGGYRIPSESFTAEVQSVVEDYDIPLVVDEIQTGVGRSGKWWASDHFPIEPDVIASAKALRVGATVSRSELFPAEKNRLGSTWGAGDVIASMVGVFTLEAIDDLDLMANATARGAQFQDVIRDADLPGVVDVRGLGLLLAVELDTADRRDAVVEAAVARGLLVTGCGHKTVRVLPPLDVTEREIALGADILAEAVEATA